MPDNSNADADGRPLTYGEYLDAESVFGDAIDYSTVRIYEGDFWGDVPIAVFDGEIYATGNNYQDDYSTAGVFSRADFLHEMTHVWQDQNYIDADGAGRMKATAEAGAYFKIYDYNLEPGKDFFDFNNEQQASIVEDYFFVAHSSTGKGTATAPFDDYQDVLPFDLYDGERLAQVPPSRNDIPADLRAEMEALFGDLEKEATENSGDPAGQEAPLTQPSRFPSSAFEAEPDNAETSALPNVEPGDAAEPSLAEPDGVEPPPEAVEPQSAAAPSPASAPLPLTPEDIANDPELAEDQRELDANRDAQDGDSTNAQEPPPGYDDRSQDEIGEEMEAALRGEAAGSDDDSEDEDEPEQPETDGSSEMPNPVDDGPSYVNDFSVLVNRNAPYVNPGPGDFDMPAAGGNIFDLLNRNAPAVNPGPGDFDMPAVSGDVSMLLNRNAPTVNPGLVDFDMPVGGDLSDLLDRNGPRQSAALDDADLAGSSVNGDLLSGFDFAGGLDDFAGFDIV